MNDYGPFGSEQEANATPAARKARAEIDALFPSMGPGCHIAPNSRIVFDACEATGVELGEFDQSIITGLGNWETFTSVVIGGLIRRAYGAGLAARDEPRLLPSAAAIRQWLAEHDWTVCSTGPGGTMHCSPNGRHVGVPRGDGDPDAITGAVKRIAAAEVRDETALTREIRDLFKDAPGGGSA